MIQNLVDDVVWNCGDSISWDSGGVGILWWYGNGMLWDSGDDDGLGFYGGVALCFRGFRTHSRSVSRDGMMKPDETR